MLFTLYSAVVGAAQARLDVCSTCSTLLYVAVLLNLRVNAVFPLYWRCNIPKNCEIVFIGVKITNFGLFHTQTFIYF